MRGLHFHIFHFRFPTAFYKRVVYQSTFFLFFVSQGLKLTLFFVNMNRTLLVFIIILLFFNCTHTDENKLRLENEIKLTGVYLYGGYGHCSATYDKDKNVVTIILSSKLDIEREECVDKQLANEGLRIALCGDLHLLKLMADAKASCSLNHSTHEIARLSPEVIQDMLNHPIKKEEREILLLENYVAKTNSALPNQIADGVTYRKVEIKGDYVVQEYSIDENLYDMNEIERMLNAHKYDEIHSEHRLRGVLSVYVAGRVV